MQINRKPLCVLWTHERHNPCQWCTQWSLCPAGESLPRTKSAGLSPVTGKSSRCLASVLQLLSISAFRSVHSQGVLPFANAESALKPRSHTDNDAMDSASTSEQSSAFSPPAESGILQTSLPTGNQENFLNKALHRHASIAQEYLLCPSACYALVICVELVKDIQNLRRSRSSAAERNVAMLVYQCIVPEIATRTVLTSISKDNDILSLIPLLHMPLVQYQPAMGCSRSAALP